MFGFLLTLLIIDGLLLMVIVLLQSGKGGGLAAMGGGGAGTETFLGGRQAATLLTRATWISGGVFLFLALVLSILSSRQLAPESILRQEFQQAAPVAPQPVVPGVETAPGEGQPGATGTGEGAAETPAPAEPETQP